MTDCSKSQVLMVEGPHIGRRTGICHSVCKEGRQGCVRTELQRLMRNVVGAWSNPHFRSKYEMFYNGLVREINRADGKNNAKRECDPLEDGRIARLLSEPREGHASCNEEVRQKLNRRLERLPKPGLIEISQDDLHTIFEATGWMNVAAAELAYGTVKSDSQAAELREEANAIKKAGHSRLVKSLCDAVVDAANHWMDYSEMS